MGYGNFTATCSGATDNAGNSAQPASVSYAVQPPPNDTNSVSISSTGLIYNRIKKTGSETVTVTNTAGQNLAGPLQLVVSNLPAGVTLVNATGTWGGNPYVTVTGSSLAPGASVSLTLTFSYSAGPSFNATPQVYSGTLRN
jgi:hypothetical protein